MMVGPSGSGKSAAWSVLLKALERMEGMEGVAHVIDPKVRRSSELGAVNSELSAFGDLSQKSMLKCFFLFVFHNITVIL